LIFLLPAVLGTGTKPIGYNKGAPPLIRPLSGNKPYHQVVGNGNHIHHALNSQRSAPNSKPAEKKVEGSPIVYKSGRPYEHSDAFMGNRPYYGKEKNTVLAEKKVIAKKYIPMGNRRSYEDLDVPMGNRPYYGKEKKTFVAEKKVIAKQSIPMGNRRSYENLDIPMGNRPYYGKVKKTNVVQNKVASKTIPMGNRRSYENLDIPMGNRPYYGKEKNTKVAEKKVAVKKSRKIATMESFEDLDIPMGNRPYYVSHDEARPYKGKFYGNRAYYGKPTQEYLNRHHSKKNKHMGNRKYYEDETRLMGNRPYYEESKSNKENSILKVANSPPKGVFPMFGNRPYLNQREGVYDW